MFQGFRSVYSKMKIEEGSYLLIKAVPGLEDVSALEVKNLLKNLEEIIIRPYGVLGRILIRVNAPVFELAQTLNEKARSIEKVIVLLGICKVKRTKDGLNEIYELIKGSKVSSLLTPHETFGIRPSREGKHEYTSLDIGRVGGDAIIDKIQETYGERPAVDLKHPANIVYCDVVGDTCMVGVDTTGDMALHKRGYRVFDHPAALRPTIAYAMIKIAGVREKEILLDPFCGGGTILIEAAHMYKNLGLFGIDLFAQNIKGAYLNAICAGVSEKINFIVGDATKLNKIFNVEVDRIVCNPPYGIRQLRGEKSREVPKLYDKFLSSASKILADEGVICIVTPKRRAIQISVDKSKLKILHKREIYHGGLKAYIFVIGKRDGTYRLRTLI